MRARVERVAVAIAIAPMAAMFVLIACAMAGPREGLKIVRRDESR